MNILLKIFQIVLNSLYLNLMLNEIAKDPININKKLVYIINQNLNFIDFG